MSFHRFRLMQRVYLDYISASPLLPAAKAAMLPYLGEQFGNPQSRHGYGDAPRAAVATARLQVANLIGAVPTEILFTASGSEANNLAIRGVVAAGRKKGRHLVASVVEHVSVAHPMKRLAQEGYEVTWIPVDRVGRVNPNDVMRAIRPDTILVSILHANNEIGTVQPISEIAGITQAADVLLHTDAVGTIGVVPFDVDHLGIDLASFAASSFYGPKGAGGLYVRRGTRVVPLIDGGVQEGGRRAGTENVAAIVGMGVAAEVARGQLEADAANLLLLRDRLIDGLLKTIDRIHLTGDRTMRLPHVASFAVEYVDGEALIRRLEKRGVVAASGSSCSADALKISPVLTALGFSANVAQGAIVFSLGRATTDAEISQVLSVMPECVAALRATSPLFSRREVSL